MSPVKIHVGDAFGASAIGKGVCMTGWCAWVCLGNGLARSQWVHRKKWFSLGVFDYLQGLVAVGRMREGTWKKW